MSYIFSKALFKKNWNKFLGFSLSVYQQQKHSKLPNRTYGESKKFISIFFYAPYIEIYQGTKNWVTKPEMSYIFSKALSKKKLK